MGSHYLQLDFQKRENLLAVQEGRVSFSDKRRRPQDRGWRLDGVEIVPVWPYPDLELERLLFQGLICFSGDQVQVTPAGLEYLAQETA